MGVEPLFLTVDDKPMEMAVRPPQDELKDMVKISDGGIRGNEKTTPDQGTDATQGNLELVNNSIWWVKHEGSLSELLASHLPCFLADSADSLDRTKADQLKRYFVQRLERLGLQVTVQSREEIVSLAT
jgi:hypothetical protein